MHILMADDDRDDFMILKEAASKTGVALRISYAANWMELWSNLLKALPDVIFLDLNMPVKDGFECLQTLRSDNKFAGLPIIMYSTSLSKADIDKAYQAGANYFIVKPNSLDETVNVLHRVSAMDRQLLAGIPAREAFVIV